MSLAFLDQFLADRADGRDLPMQHYLAQWPGAEEIVARQYLRVHGQHGHPTLDPVSDLPLLEGSLPLTILPIAERFEIGERLGAGGMGEVYRARDRTLNREVALKFARRRGLADRGLRDALLHEALVAAQLIHPNIPPIFDVGVDESGRFFYAMRLIEGRSLDDLLRGDLGPPYHRLTLMQQVCVAIDYAHSRGIVHLDLKPANVMVGDYGELYVVDWGLSSQLAGLRIAGGSIRGTPSYMSPEQARGRRLGPASDAFSLGAMLYEVITGARAFRGTVKEVLERVSEARFEQGEAWNAAPEELRDLCARSLSKSPRSRPTVRAIHDALQSYLDGSRERDRRRRAAQVAIESAEERLSTRGELRRESTSLLRQAERAAPASWAALEKKRPYWRLLDRSRQNEEEAAILLEDATSLLAEAYRQAPNEPGVRLRFAKLLWDRLGAAEDIGDAAAARLFASQLRALDEPHFEKALRGDGSFEIHCEPRATRATLRRFAVRDGVLRAQRAHALPLRPVQSGLLPMGSYEVTLERRGYRMIRAPVYIGRAQHQKLSWRFRRESEIGAEFVQIPSGPFIMGGDPGTMESVPRARIFVREFCIARFPTTFYEYLEFIQDLHERSPRRALERTPRVARGGRPMVTFEKRDGSLLLPRRSLPESRFPVAGVDWNDATAYARWRSKRDGVRYALASDAEWEKAARGVDGRTFPWGQRYDATFCNNVGSHPDRAHPEPIGKRRRDESPYGVRDLAGGVKEWCRSWFSQRQNQRLIRGGGWNQSPLGAHCAYRLGGSPDQVHPFIGFRLVHHFGTL